MQYIIHKLSNLLRRTPVYDDSKKQDQMYNYIVEKSKIGPSGTYLYSNPKKNLYYKLKTSN